MADDNPFAVAQAQSEADDNPFAAAQAEADAAGITQSNNNNQPAAADNEIDPFDEPDPDDLFTASAASAAKNNNNNNITNPQGQTATATAVPTTQVQPVQVVQQVVVVQQQGPITGLTREQALKMSQLRPGPCCILHKNEDNKPAMIEFFLQFTGITLTFCGLFLDLLASHYTANLDVECGVLGCRSNAETGCNIGHVTVIDLFSSKSHLVTYYNTVCIDNASKYPDDDCINGYCDLSTRGLFWFLFTVLSLFIFSLVLAIYLQRDCKFMVVEFPGCKCGKYTWRLSKRWCLYLSIFNWLIILIQILTWTVSNYLFDENEQEINYDIGLSIWFNIVTLILITLGLIHGYYQPQVFSPELP